VVPLIKALHPGLIRYPGGSLANTFRFVHSLGPLGARQPVANFFTIKGHWTEKVEYQTEKPLLGFDDFMGFTRATEAAGAMVTVNCTWWPHNPEISGTAQEAAAWVAYANVAPGATPVPIGIDRRGINWRDSRYWANLRKQHGHHQPYNVTYWEIGNEIYDPSQGAGASGVEYAATAREFAHLMKAVDPSIKIGAVIACDHPGWNDAAITLARPGLIDFLSLHTYGPGITTGSVALWHNRSVDIPLPVFHDGAYIIIIEASGQPLRGVGPLMRVAVDGQVLGETFVDVSRASGQSANYRYARKFLAGQHTLTVSFLNDAHESPEDRNLFIEAVYLRPQEGKPEKLRLRPREEMMKLLSAHADLLDRCLAQVGGALRARGATLPIQVTEFNALYGTRLADLKESGDLKSALFSARYLQKFLENPMIEGANFWCLKSNWFKVLQNGPQGLQYAPAGLIFQAMAPLSRV
jgi:Ca-dependent carbohydrate-binding module xylan-binding